LLGDPPISSSSGMVKLRVRVEVRGEKVSHRSACAGRPKR